MDKEECDPMNLEFLPDGMNPETCNGKGIEMCPVMEICSAESCKGEDVPICSSIHLYEPPSKRLPSISSILSISSSTEVYRSAELTARMMAAESTKTIEALIAEDKSIADVQARLSRWNAAARKATAAADKVARQKAARAEFKSAANSNSAAATAAADKVATAKEVPDAKALASKAAVTKKAATLKGAPAKSKSAAKTAAAKVASAKLAAKFQSAAEAAVAARKANGSSVKEWKKYFEIMHHTRAFGITWAPKNAPIVPYKEGDQAKIIEMIEDCIQFYNDKHDQKYMDEGVEIENVAFSRPTRKTSKRVYYLTFKTCRVADSSTKKTFLALYFAKSFTPMKCCGEDVYDDDDDEDYIEDEDEDEDEDDDEDYNDDDDNDNDDDEYDGLDFYSDYPSCGVKRVLCCDTKDKLLSVWKQGEPCALFCCKADSIFRIKLLKLGY